MALLLDSERTAAWAEMMRLASELNVSLSVLKAALKSAVDATDAWIDSNAASYNSALPVAVRNNLTAKQKAQLFMLVAKRRFDVS